MDDEVAIPQNDEKMQIRMTEELIINLEIYIECMKENVLIYKNLTKYTFIQNREFILEYVNLEENILTTFDKLNNLKINSNQYKRIELLLIEFNIYWKDFQDEWCSELWEIYETILKKGRIKVIFHEQDTIKEEEREKMNKEVIIF
jgi:hypothetical protein